MTTPCALTKQNVLSERPVTVKIPSAMSSSMKVVKVVYATFFYGPVNKETELLKKQLFAGANVTFRCGLKTYLHLLTFGH